MRALYKDMYLSDEQVGTVRDYIRSVDFHLPGATPDDFQVNRRARYLGYMFQEEHLESYGVGLRCTHPELDGQATFIRMSRDQLLGREDPLLLPVNEPVIASEAMLMDRFRDRPANKLETGIDVYLNDEGLPGGDLDLSMLEAQLNDIVEFHNGEPVYWNQEILDIRINWGSLMAGRYPRLKHFQAKGELSAEQERRLSQFESNVNAIPDILESLELATLDTLQTRPVVDG